MWVGSPFTGRGSHPLDDRRSFVNHHIITPLRPALPGRTMHQSPAMQAGVASTRLTWSDIFTAPGRSRRLGAAVVRILATVLFIDTGLTARPTVSWPFEQKLAA